MKLLAPLLVAASLAGADTETRGVTDRELKQLLRDHWVWLQEQEPRVAMAAGDRNSVWRFGLRSPSALGERRSEATALLERAEAMSTAGLDVEDLEHHGLLVRHLQGVVDEVACGFEQWRVVPQANPLMRANSLATIRELHIVWSERAVAQLKHVPRDVDESLKNPAAGAGEGPRLRPGVDRAGDRAARRRAGAGRVGVDDDHRRPRPPPRLERAPDR